MKTNLKKTLFATTLFMAIFALALTSCKKDKDPDPDPTPVINHNDWKGNITTDVTLDAANIYKLTGMVYVKDGGKLRIPAGTRIEGMGGTSSAIIVEQGGQIFVNGTATNPVVMTSGLANPSRGDWGGLVICGRATCNSGGGMSEVGDVPYGGNIDNDNSGTIRYLRIEWSGAAFNSEKEYNGFSLFGVGSGTTIEYVQIHENADDGIEFYGGTVSASYIVVTNAEDDMFDWTEGWVPATPCNYWYGKNAAGFGNRGIEADNWETNNTATPFANPTINNITLIGSGDQGPEPQGMELRRGTKGTLNNVVLKDWKIGIRVSGTDSQGFLGGDLKVTNVKFINCDTNISAGTGDASSITVNESATGAGNGVDVPTWAQGWTVGL